MFNSQKTVDDFNHHILQNNNNFFTNFADFFSFTKIDIVDWIENNINLGNDITSAHRGFAKLRNYQKIIAQEYTNDNYNEFIFMACERAGKSLTWKCLALYSMANWHASIGVAYPTEKDAKDTNRDTIEPLMRDIPKFMQALRAPNSKRNDRYSLFFAVMYFMGGNADIVNITCRSFFIDELDLFPDPNIIDERSSTKKSSIHNYENALKRTRTYGTKKKMFAATSPKTTQHKSWQLFTKSNQSFYVLQCQFCKLGIPTHATGNLREVEKIIMLKCPHCKNLHNFEQAEKMTENGWFYSKYPNRKKRGYQLGALATPSNWSWNEIYEKFQQFKADKKNQEIRNLYFPTVRGMPIPPTIQQITNEEVESRIEEHIYNFSIEEIIEKMISLLISVDSQSKSYYFVVRALFFDGSTQLVCNGEIFGETSQQRILNFINFYKNYKFGGMNIAWGIIDTGGIGYRTTETQKIIDNCSGIFGYKGNNQIRYYSENFKISTTTNKLLICNEKEYRVRLLSLLFDYNKYSPGMENYFFIPKFSENYVFKNSEFLIENVKISKKYLKQLNSYIPESNSHFLNWKLRNNENHFFDCEKMLLVLIDYFIYSYKCNKKSARSMFFYAQIPQFIENAASARIEYSAEAQKKMLIDENEVVFFKKK